MRRIKRGNIYSVGIYIRGAVNGDYRRQGEDTNVEATMTSEGKADSVIKFQSLFKIFIVIGNYTLKGEG